ncbi:MAG: hypothetical protein VZR04_00030 [Succiniclasticum sp.]|jgi:hypothetical protein|nr:hypothetical protein [Succiniclasticum sp.]
MHRLLQKHEPSFRKKRARLLLPCCIALALAGRGGPVSAEGTEAIPVLAEESGHHVTIEGNSASAQWRAVRLSYETLQNAPSGGVLYAHDNSITVRNRTAPATGSSLTVVEAVPSFKPPEDGTVKGLVRIEDNETAVENSTLPNVAVYAVHDLTDNWNGKDGSSLVASNNRLTISDNSTVGEVAHVTLEEPHSDSRNVIQKNVTAVANSTVQGLLYGTVTTQRSRRPFGSLERRENTISVTDSTLESHVMGANIYDADLFTAENNTLTVSNSTVNGYLANDYAYGTTGTYNLNKLRIDNGSKVLIVLGESFANADPGNGGSTSSMTNNEVCFTGNSTAGAILGTVSEGTDESSEARGNKLTISDRAGVLFGAASITTGTAEGNRVNAADGEAQVLVAGLSTGSGRADGNIVSLSGNSRLVPAEKMPLDSTQAYYGSYFVSGFLGQGFGSSSSPLVLAGFTDSGTASNNEVWVSGKTDLSQADVYGAADASQAKPAGSGNTFRIGYQDGTASRWEQPQVRGLRHFDKIALHDLDPRKAGLVVTDTLDLPATAELEIGKTALSRLNEPLRQEEGKAAVTLAVKDPAVLIDASQAGTVTGLDALYRNSAGRIRNQNTWNYLDGGVTVTGTTGLTLPEPGKVLSYGLHSLDTITYRTVDWLTGGTVLKLHTPENFSLAATKVDTRDISFTAESLAAIDAADQYSMTLLDTDGNTTLSPDNLTTGKGTWNIGNALTGTGEAYLAENGNVLYQLDVAKAPDVPETPVVEATKETHNALIAREAELSVLASGRDRMDGVLAVFNGQEAGIFTFADLGGSKDRYDTGSHATTHAWNGLAGAGNEQKFSAGVLGYALFYEYGQSNYDVAGRGFAGSGNIHYNGGGAMMKWTARNKDYYEGAFRAGRIKNSADNVLHDRNGSPYSYQTSARYWSGHVGIGHVFDLTGKTASESEGGIRRAARDIDVYGKYFHTHIGSGSFTAGEVQYGLDGLDSRLLRIGARADNRSGRNDFYYGLAWDYELDGEGRGRVAADGLRAPIEKTDTGGSSLMAEIGWKKEATKEDPWDLKAVMTGYAGEHKGIGGSLFAGYHF